MPSALLADTSVASQSGVGCENLLQYNCLLPAKPCSSTAKFAFVYTNFVFQGGQLPEHEVAALAAVTMSFLRNNHCKVTTNPEIGAVDFGSLLVESMNLSTAGNLLFSLR